MLPSAAGGVTGGAYVWVDHTDAHYDRAVAAGAEITLALQDQEDRGGMYSAKDPEGFLWHFGSYDPWVE